jgi:ribosomal protein S18 acetylase RimI-like enzyme
MRDLPIIPIALDHVPSFHAALDIVCREKKYLAFLEAPPLAETEEFVRRNIAEGHPQFVALDGARVVGWCDIIPNRARPVYLHCGTLGIALLPAYRHQGLGRRLMRRAIDAAFACGLTRIELTVRESNANAIALYKSLGFTVEGFHRNAVRIDGRYENIHSMALLRP